MAATTQHFAVDGMTCEHCVSAVTEEVSAIPGVEDVGVELATGEVIVQSEGSVEESAVAAAVDEAGYRLAS